MKEHFVDHNFGGEARDLLARCIQVTEDYMAQGLRLTLRQLYYQLVTQNIIVNKERSYKNLSRLVSRARLAGLVDWDAIEDRGRPPHRSSEWDSIADLVESAVASYRLPRWEGQNKYVELWVEKDALAGVLSPLAKKHHVTLMVNKGYSSQTAMYEASKRFIDHRSEIQSLFYIGDFDPSGEDMVRDIRDRLYTFGAAEVDVYKLALTKDQIASYSLPPNPAKTKDPRARGFIEKHGGSSWEVDALPPNVLTLLIDNAIDKEVDKKLLLKIKKREKDDIKLLREAVA